MGCAGSKNNGSEAAAPASQRPKKQGGAKALPEPVALPPPRAAEGVTFVPLPHAAKATKDAIAANVARALSADERERLRAKYYDSETLFEALERAGVVLLRASWLKSQGRGELPKRGDVAPAAEITVSELREISGRSTAAVALPIIVLSSVWTAETRPDPGEDILGHVASALASSWPLFEAKGLADLGVIIEASSLPEGPRTEAQLDTMNQVYAHAGTTVWLATDCDARGRTYWDSGCTRAQFALAMMIKPPPAAADWPPVLDLAHTGASPARPAPVEPLAFFDGHCYGAMKYAASAEREEIVAPRFRDTLFELLAGVTEMSRNNLNWGDPEVAQLVVLLPLCAKLDTLALFGNAIGPRGAKSLARAIAANSQLTKFDVGRNNFGQGGAAALAEALKANTALTSLAMYGNAIGAGGAAACADMLRAHPALRTLHIRFNDIGDSGAAAVADALGSNGVLTDLDVHNNRISDEGVARLADALKLNTALGTINLSRNNIGGEGAVAVAEALKRNTTLTSLNILGNPIGNQGSAALAALAKVNTRIAIIGESAGPGDEARRHDRV